MPGTMSTYNSLLLPLSNEVQPTPKLTGTHTEPQDLVWVILHLSPPFGFSACYPRGCRIPWKSLDTAHSLQMGTLVEFAFCFL